MIRTTNCIIFFFLLSISVIGQETCLVKFNHLSFIIEYQDLKAFRESSFVNDTLGVLETRTTKIDSVTTSTVNFLYGRSNYLELFETSAEDPNLGFLTLAFSVDKINGLNELKNYLDTIYQTGIRNFERNLDGVKVPWYDALTVLDRNIIDSVFLSQCHIWFWIMEYKTEYFKYHGYTIENDELTRERYLEKHVSGKENRIIKRFSGIVMKLNPKEKEYITKFFKTIGYERINESEYMSSDKFRFFIIERQPGDQNSIESIKFETSKEFLSRKVVKISENITISIQGNEGQISFK